MTATRQQTTVQQGSRKRSSTLGPCHDWSDVRLARVARCGSPFRKRQALTVLVERHADLVEKVASVFRSSGLSHDDLVSEGVMGLMRAAEKYRPGGGASFRTYAVFWIRRAMHRALDNQVGAVRIPPASGDRFRKLQALRLELEDRMGREATTAELARTMGVSERVIKNLEAVDIHVVSIHSPVHGADELSLGDMLPDENVLDPVSILMKRERLELLHRGVDQLDQRGSEVIRRRFGLAHGEPETLERIGHRIGATRECVRKIQQRSIRRLQELLSPHAEDLCAPSCCWSELPPPWVAVGG